VYGGILRAIAISLISCEIIQGYYNPKPTKGFLFLNNIGSHSRNVRSDICTKYVEELFDIVS